MREIKFRAWKKEQKEMGIVTAIVCNENSGRIEQVQIKITCDGYQGFTTDHKDEVELMQYTGLKDKNCKEIYEGDIFKDAYGSLFKVSYDAEELIYIVNCIGEDYSWNISRFKTDEFEVIGNIYENPELLEEGK